MHIGCRLGIIAINQTGMVCCVCYFAPMLSAVCALPVQITTTPAPLQDALHHPPHSRRQLEVLNPRPEPVEYVPDWQRLQEAASGAPASTVLQHRTKPNIVKSDQARSWTDFIDMTQAAAGE